MDIFPVSYQAFEEQQNLLHLQNHSLYDELPFTGLNIHDPSSQSSMKSIFDDMCIEHFPIHDLPVLGNLPTLSSCPSSEASDSPQLYGAHATAGAFPIISEPVLRSYSSTPISSAPSYCHMEVPQQQMMSVRSTTPTAFPLLNLSVPEVDYEAQFESFQSSSGVWPGTPDRLALQCSPVFMDSVHESALEHCYVRDVTSSPQTPRFSPSRGFRQQRDVTRRNLKHQSRAKRDRAVSHSSSIDGMPAHARSAHTTSAPRTSVAAEVMLPSSAISNYMSPSAGFEVYHPSTYGMDDYMLSACSSPMPTPSLPVFVGRAHSHSDASYFSLADLQSYMTFDSPEQACNSSRPMPRCYDHGCKGRQFSTFSNLLRHQREKSGVAAKPHCPRCGAEFTRSTAMKSHLAHDKCKARRASDPA